jgi:uncharacterized protein involved in outer membrane biogenesis
VKKNLIRIVLVLVVLLIAGFVAAAFFLGSIVTQGVNRVAPTITKVETKLDGANISLLSGKGELKGLFLGNPEGFKTPSAIKVGSVSLAIKAGSILSDKIVVQSIQVNAPEITFEGSLSGNNLSKILENIQLAAAALTGPTDGSKQAPAGGGKKIQVEDFAITGGKINLSMTILGGKSLTVPLPDIHLQNLGTDASGITPAELAEKIFKEISSSSTKAAADAVANLAKGATDAVKNIGKSTGATLEKTTKGIGDMFKKK